MKQVLSDIFKAFIFVLFGAPKNPKRFAKTPPAFWHKATPEKDVPKRKTSNAVEIGNDQYTPEEILAMTESEYGSKCGTLGIQSWQEARKEAEKRLKKSRKSNATQVEIEF